MATPAAEGAGAWSPTGGHTGATGPPVLGGSCASLELSSFSVAMAPH